METKILKLGDNFYLFNPEMSLEEFVEINEILVCDDFDIINTDYMMTLLKANYFEQEDLN